MSNEALTTIAANSRTTIQFNNSTVFYSLVNSAFLPYYQQIVRKAQQWLDGFDPEFHKEDIFSSRIAEKIVNGLAKSTFGKGLLFKKGKGNTDTENKALNFATNWADEVGLNNIVKQLIAYTEGLGTACLKVNKDLSGKLWLEPQRLDYFLFSVNGRKELVSYTGFIRSFQTVETKERNYFLVEKRYFQNEPICFEEQINGKKKKFVQGYERVPYVEYSIHVYEGLVTNNTMPSAINSKGVNYRSLPKDVKDALKTEFGFLKVDEPIRLPFKDWLGVELFFNEGGDITNPTLPFGRSLVFSNLLDFIEYDMERSYAVRDLYNSRGIVGVPTSLSQGALVGGADVAGTAGNLHSYGGTSVYGTLPIPSYEVIPNLNPESQKPIITQFEIRASEHETKQNAIIRSIALNIGVSPKMLASYLIGGTQQTDDQIQSEDNSVIQWVKSHRQDFIPGLNRIVENILNYSGIADNVSVCFASDDLLKEDTLLASIEKRMSLGLIDVEDAIRELYPDLDEEQLQIKIKKAKHLQEQQKDDMLDLDPFANEEEQFN